jgi:hypothetical protein
MNMKTFHANGEDLVAEPLIYRNGRIAIQVYDMNHEPYCMFTSNVEEAPLESDEMCIPVWNMPQAFVAEVLATGLFEDTGKRFPTAHVVAPVWKLLDQDMLEVVEAMRERMASETH